MRLKEGDVFTIPINETSLGFGQIVCVPNNNNFMIIVFKGQYDIDNLPVLSEVLSNEILLLGYTLDAKLYHKHWEIKGNLGVNLDKIQLPYFKLGTPPGRISLLDHKGVELRECTKEEFEKLNYLTVVAPARYENALKAFYKEIEWNHHFDKLLYTSQPSAPASL